MSIKSLLSVIVLYKCSLEESESIRSLQEALLHSQKQLTLLVYDNGPERQYTEKCFTYGNFNIIYEHDSKNPGLSKAYNEGLRIAANLDVEWILLLDQDTIFTPDFLEFYLEAIRERNIDEIVCIIPKALSASDNSLFSPSKLYPGGIIRPINKIKPGVIKKSLTSVNSGTFIARDFMQSIGGFNNDFPLDMLDHWYFREIMKRKKKVYILDTCIKHDLSVNSFFDEVSIYRYDNILLSETKFFKDRISDLIVYKIRLVSRLVKQLLAGKTEYAKLTFKFLFK